MVGITKAILVRIPRPLSNLPEDKDVDHKNESHALIIITDSCSTDEWQPSEHRDNDSPTSASSSILGAFVREALPQASR